MNAGDVMTRDVLTVSPDTPVTEIVNLLLSRIISGVPVVESDGTVVGVVSEGDLLRRAEIGTEKKRSSWVQFFTGTASLADEYVRSHGRVAKDVMTQAVVSVQPDTPIAAIADIMHQKRIKRVPVVQDGKLVGIVTRKNILRAFASMRSPEAPSKVDDTRIRETLLAELAQQPWSRRAENSVVVTDGVVHLWGLVSTQEELRALEVAAEATPGVKGVKNHMIVLSEEPYPLFPGSFAA